MILIYVDRGLGNQMFQYAYGLVLANRTGAEVKYDLSYLDKYIEKRKTFSINDIFVYEFKIASKWEIWNYTGCNPIVNYLKYKITSVKQVEKPKNRNCKYVEEPESRYLINEKVIKNLLSIDWKAANNYYVKGFWEDMKYFEGYEALIRNSFRFKQKIPSKKYPEIFKENSVSVHIRRGDYLNQGKNSKFCICNKEYYKCAMQIMINKIQNPFFIFFSDDYEYVKEKYKWMKNKIIISGNRDYIDLQLMTLCAHNIVANSTFSFWGGFLNKNKGKIVIAPKIHYLIREGSWHAVNFPAEKSWIQLDNLHIKEKQEKKEGVSI